MMSEESSFVEISAERRINDDTKKARYNKYKSPKETKEYISRTTRNKKKGISKTYSAKRRGKEDWDVIEYDGPKSDTSKGKTSTKKDLTSKDAFVDFPELNVDSLVKSIGGGDCSMKRVGACGTGRVVGGRKMRSKKKSSKKKSSRKRSKKKSSKKGGSRKRRSKK